MVQNSGYDRFPLAVNDWGAIHPIREGASWVDLASTDQLDPPPSTTGTKGDKKLGFGDKK
jgi:hypothetical protein